MELKEIGEFGLIERLAGILEPASGDFLRWIGDDAAVVQLEPGLVLVLTADMLAEGVHFRKGYGGLRDLGYKALAVNLSDLAAMGARGGYALVCLGLPPGMQVEEVEEFYRGIAEAATEWDCRLAGGDTVASPSGLVFSVSLAALLRGRDAVTRSGARAGDVVLVTGTLGSSALGLALFERGAPACSAAARECVLRHVRPRPRLAEGVEAALAGATAMIDVSDGFLADLGHICDQSGLGARIDVDELPVAEPAREVARELALDVLDAALAGGEDYELIITVGREAADELAATTGATRVGVMTEGAGITLLRDGGVWSPGRAGYEHFGGDA
ncbi:MAG: thiamine-phosphate kinase [Candidatus Geothermincolia bacterium]